MVLSKNPGVRKALAKCSRRKVKKLIREMTHETWTNGVAMKARWDTKEGESYEIRETTSAVVECPKCSKEVGLIAETEEWQLENDGKWHHTDYGAAVGGCCGLVIVDWLDGIHVYELPV